MGRVKRGIVAGAIGGLGATALMSVVMLAARRLGVTERLPPGKMAEKAIEAATQRQATDDETTVVASAAHFAFGAAAGVGFGILTARLPRVPLGAIAGLGALYGTAIWFMSYQGWVPGLGIMPPASRDDPGRVTTMIVAHWVYGATLGIAAERLRLRMRS